MTEFTKSRSIAWMVWMAASVFYAYQYILRVMPSILLDDICQQFHIGAGAFGQFSGIYYIGYSALHLPMGILLDRVGPKKIMSGSLLLITLGLMPLLFAENWAYPLIGRALIGIGSSAAILGLFKIIRMTFSEARFARMLSISVTIGLVGAIYGGSPVSMMRDAYGSKAVVECFALVGVLLALVTYWIIPNIKSESSGTIYSDVKEVLSNRRVLALCFSAGLMVGPVEGFADVWGVAFLKQVCGFDSAIAAGLPSMIFIGMCFGSPALTFIADKIGYFLAIVLSGLIMVAGFLGFLFTPLSSGAISLSFGLIGVCCAYQILAIYKASTSVREQVAGLTTAAANMIIMIFGYAFHTAIGTMVNYMGGASNSQALIYGVAIIPVGLSLGTLGFTYLYFKEKRLSVNVS